jgi:hypothetical protein
MPRKKIACGSLGYGRWRIRVGRFFLGFWLHDVVGWNWWTDSHDGKFRYMAFGIGEVRWYKSFRKEGEG